MGSSSTSWSSESNTHAGSSKAYDSTSWSLYTTTSGLRISGAEGQTAQLELWADEGDDNADKWLWDVADGGSMTWQSYTSGSYATKLTLSTAGALTVAGATQLNSTLTVGANDTGYDVTFFGATSGKKLFWDESADTLYQTCTVDIDGTVTVGVDNTGYDVKFFGATSGSYMIWDESLNKLELTGTSIFRMTSDSDVPIKVTSSDSACGIDLQDSDSTGTFNGPMLVGDNLRFRTLNTDRMTMNATGLGIGTTSPIQSLSVESSDLISASFGKEEDESKYISVVTGNYNAGYAGISFSQNRSATSSSVDIFAGVRGQIQSANGATEITGSLELLYNSGDSFTVGATLDETGKFGIGTGTPSTKLHVIGDVQVGINDTGHDVRFYGATSGSYMVWDQVNDTLKLTDSTPLKIGDGLDMTLYHNGSNSFITNAVGALNIATLTSGIAVNIGHTASETTIGDNLTVTGQFALKNSASPGAHTDDQVFIGAKNSAGTGTDTLSTLQIFAEEGVDATAMSADPSSTFTHRFPIWINDTAYWVALDPV